MQQPVTTIRYQDASHGLRQLVDDKSVASCQQTYIDEDVKGAEGNHTNMDIDESDPRSDVAIKDNLHGLDKESVTPEMYPCRKEVLKDISSFQNRVDLMTPVSESADIGHLS